MYEATAKRLVEELRINNSGVSETAYHEAKQIEATRGAYARDGDVLVPGYDVEGKLWTVQYGKEDGTKRFAKNSRKHGCFHVVDAAKGPTALQKIALSPVVVIEEGYATAAMIAKYGVAQGLTYFNDLAIQNPEVVSRQLNEILQGIREQRLAASQSVELACSLTFAQQKL